MLETSFIYSIYIVDAGFISMKRKQNDFHIRSKVGKWKIREIATQYQSFILTNCDIIFDRVEHNKKKRKNLATTSPIAIPKLKIRRA